MPDNSSAIHPQPYGIGGWLLLYIIHVSLGIIVTILTSLVDLMKSREMSELFTPTLIITILSILWCILYSVFLYHLVRLRKGAVTRIKEMLVGNLLFCAVVPCIFSGLLVNSIPGAKFSEVVAAAYDRSTVTALISTAIVTAIWHRYFCVSKRIRNTWPEEGLTDGIGNKA